VNKHLSFILAALWVFPSALVAAPKIATFNIARVIDEYKRTKTDVAEYKAKKVKLEEDPRKKAVEEMRAKLEEIFEKLQAAEEGSDEQAMLGEDGQETQIAYNDLAREWEEYRVHNLRVITEQFIDTTNKRNADVMKIAQELGDSLGFDWVLELSGITSSKTPVVLYVRDATDLTEQVIKGLNRKEPVTEGTESTKPEAPDPNPQ
jgi:Skp family chaperone for outer membrane proteins